MKKHTCGMNMTIEKLGSLIDNGSDEYTQLLGRYNSNMTNWDESENNYHIINFYSVTIPMLVIREMLEVEVNNISKCVTDWK